MKTTDSNSHNSRTIPFSRASRWFSQLLRGATGVFLLSGLVACDMSGVDVAPLEADAPEQRGVVTPDDALPGDEGYVPVESDATSDNQQDDTWLDENEDDWDDWDNESDWDWYNNLSVTSGAMQGTIGTMQINDRALETSGYTDSWMTSIQGLSYNRLGVGMALMSMFEMDLNDPLFTPGNRLVFRSYEGLVHATDASGQAVEADGDEYLDLVGCSGPSQSDWDFDEPADEVEIEVEEQDGSLILMYQAKFSNGEELQGVFEIQL